MNSESISERDFEPEKGRDLPPAVVVSGHTMALGVVRSLGRWGAGCRRPLRSPRHGSVLAPCRGAISLPHPEHRTAEFLQVLRQCARSFPGAVLIPASDDSLVTVSRHKEILSRDFIVAAPDWPTVRACTEKKETALLAEEWGVPAPRTVVPASSAEVERYARNVQFPCLVNPSQSHLFYERFGRKMFKVDTLPQMLEIWTCTIHHDGVSRWGID